MKGIALRKVKGCRPNIEAVSPIFKDFPNLIFEMSALITQIVSNMIDLIHLFEHFLIILCKPRVACYTQKI